MNYEKLMNNLDTCPHLFNGKTVNFESDLQKNLPQILNVFLKMTTQKLVYLFLEKYFILIIERWTKKWQNCQVETFNIFIWCDELNFLQSQTKFLYSRMCLRIAEFPFQWRICLCIKHLSRHPTATFSYTLWWEKCYVKQ